MKTVPLTVRRCPPGVHQALKKSAKVNHRSINGETLAWLEQQAATKPVSARETATILRRFQKMLSPAERRTMANKIEAARQAMSHEHLH